MSHTPHELADEFPEKADAIHALKLSNPHFAKLVDEYHEVNRAIHRAETNVEPTDDFHDAEMRKTLKAVRQDPSIRALLLTGSGRGFCAGQDLSDRSVAPGEEAPDLGESLEKRYNPMLRALNYSLRNNMSFNSANPR